MAATAHLSPDRFGHADAAGFGERPDPGRHVHALANHFAIAAQHIAEVNTDPQLQDLIVTQARLHGERAVDGENRTREDRQRLVAWCLQQLPFELLHQRLQQAAVPVARGDRARLVALGQPGVANDVGEHDCGERSPSAFVHSPPPRESITCFVQISLARGSEGIGRRQAQALDTCETASAH